MIFGIFIAKDTGNMAKIASECPKVSEFVKINLLFYFIEGLLNFIFSRTVTMRRYKVYFIVNMLETMAMNVITLYYS